MGRHKLIVTTTRETTEPDGDYTDLFLVRGTTMRVKGEGWHVNGAIPVTEAFVKDGVLTMKGEVEVTMETPMPADKKDDRRAPLIPGPGGFKVYIAPYTRTPSGGPWIVRCYDNDGNHVHSAEGGCPLDVALREVERAIRAASTGGEDRG